jgi:hypothetical protein
MPRPPSEKVTDSPPDWLTVSVLSGPYPLPTALMAMVAIPSAASVAAKLTRAWSLFGLAELPMIATGQPLAGLGPDGKTRVK